MKIDPKSTAIAAAALLLLAQLIRPEKNQSNIHPAPILDRYPASEKVVDILQRACNDCHSNYTVYPWYAEVQPVASWLANHVEEGKKHLNFSDFTNGSAKRQAHKFEEIIEMTEKGEMPLGSYTWVHRNAVLNEEEKAALIDWARSSMANTGATEEED
jgi:hypothetical protein